jgi:hypothetical protein
MSSKLRNKSQNTFIYFNEMKIRALQEWNVFINTELTLKGIEDKQK